MKAFLIVCSLLASFSVFADYSAKCRLKENGYVGLGVSEKSFLVEFHSTGASLVEPNIAKLRINDKVVVYNTGAFSQIIDSQLISYYRTKDSDDISMTVQVKDVQKTTDENFLALIVLSGKVFAGVQSTFAMDVICKTLIK